MTLHCDETTYQLYSLGLKAPDNPSSEAPACQLPLAREKSLATLTIEWIPTPCIVTDLRGRLLEMNTLARELFGQMFRGGRCACTEVLGCIAPGSQEALIEHWARVRRHKSGHSPPIELRGENTLRPWIDVQSKTITMQGGVEVVCSVIRDISQQRFTERALHRTLQAFRELLLAFPDAMVLLSGNDVTFANQRFADLLGRVSADHLVGMPFGEFIAPDHRRAVDEWLKRGQTLRSTALSTRLIASGRPFVNYNGQIRLWSICLTIEGRPQTLVLARPEHTFALDANADQTLHLAALGLMSAGVAHEINNALSNVLLNVEAARGELSTERPAYAANSDHLAEQLNLLNAAYLGAEHIRDVVRGLTAYVRGDKPQITRFLLGRAVQSAVSLARPHLLATTALTLEVPADLEIEGCETQLAQVILNLLLNAAHAIAQMGPVQRPQTIRLTAMVSHDATYLEIADTGCGILASDLERIFEPFYTTKSAERGTGLGLFLCRHYVRAHQGELSVMSVPNEGSTFRIKLPKEQTTTPATSMSSTRLELPTASTPPAVLVISEDPLWRASLLFTLRSEGIASQATNSIHEAITTLLLAATSLATEEKPGTQTLVLCDLNPESSQAAMLRESFERLPALGSMHLLFLGGAAPALTTALDHEPRCRTASKPTTRQEVLELVRAELGSAGSRSAMSLPLVPPNSTSNGPWSRSQIIGE